MRVDVRGITAAALERLPAAFDDAWLREAWSGSHGRAGLHTRVEGLSSELVLTPTGSHARALFDGGVHFPDGIRVGTIAREVLLEADGRLAVDHHLLKLDPVARRTGFAGSLNAQAFERYAQAGVDQVDVFAALSDGGYVWARTGFDLAPPRGATDAAAIDLAHARELRRMVRSARTFRHISRDEYRDLKPRLLGRFSSQVHDDTLRSVRELAAIDGVGARVLRGQAWRGVKPVDAPSTWWQATGTAGPASAADAVHQLTRSTRDQLPPALQPGVMSQAIEGATGVSGQVRLRAAEASRTAVDLLTPQLRSTGKFHLVDASGRDAGLARIVLHADADGHVHAGRDYYRFRRTPLEALDDRIVGALRSIGVEDVRWGTDLGADDARAAATGAVL